MANNLLSSSEERSPAMVKPKVNIDFEQFEKTIDERNPAMITPTDFEQLEKPIVSLMVVANFTSRLDLGRSDTVTGVTKLRTEIHVLLSFGFLEEESSNPEPRSEINSFQPNNVILVFEDEIPFRLKKRIEIEEIEGPEDITSIEIENSLYVLDHKSNKECVWKIKLEGGEKEKKEKIIRWLELEEYHKPWTSETLSVTRHGQLLLVGRRKDDPFYSLKIFGGAGSEKAELRLFIPLPEEIQTPYHAVETSKGNFIIAHSIMMKKEDESGSDGGRIQMEAKMDVVSEVSGDGKTIVRRYSPKSDEQKLDLGLSHLVVDSFDRLFLTDSWNHRVILFYSNLQWNGILIPTEDDGKEGREIFLPRNLFYDEEKKQLIVGILDKVFVYTLVENEK